MSDESEVDAPLSVGSVLQLTATPRKRLPKKHPIGFDPYRYAPKRPARQKTKAQKGDSQ